MSGKSDDREDDEELVVTPGGPRPRRLVRRVESGEAVSFDEEGEARITRRDEDDPTETEKRTDNEQ